MFPVEEMEIPVDVARPLSAATGAQPSTIPMNPFRAPFPANGRPLNIAHRGARAYAPENTLPAFEKACRLGSEALELDVHSTRDGQLVVHHDDTLDRCTDVSARFPERAPFFVSDFTLAELLSLDAGSWFVRELQKPPQERRAFLRTLSSAEMRRQISDGELREYRSGRVRLPLLREALELARAHSVSVNIELKTLPRMYPGLTAAVLALIKQMGLESAVLLSSFDHERLLEIRQLGSTVATAVLTSDRLARPADYLRLLEADACHPGCYGEYDSLGFGSVTGDLDTAAIASVRAAGKGVNVWTCNDPARMRQLIAAGVTGIITDYPDRLRAVCDAIP